MPPVAPTTQPPATPLAARGPARRIAQRAWPFLAVVLALHVIGFGVYLTLVAPQHLQAGSQTFGIGLALTAYLFGLRHAFDPDHIAAIDNTTRALSSGANRPVSVGFWFSLGHSTVVCAMAALVAGGAAVVHNLVSDDSSMRDTLGLIGTGISGVFLLLLGLVNIIALVGIFKAFRAMRDGHHDDAELERLLASRGLFARILAPLLARVARPWHIYPIGLLFGLGFDTATEIALLVLAGTGSAAGLPWYAIMTLPVLFTAGMSLMDTLDGVFMAVAYDWAFARPARKIYYNLTVTGLSVAVALAIGGIEIVQVLHDRLVLSGPVVDAVAGLQLDQAGFAIVALFAVTWSASVIIWRVGRFERATDHPSLPATTHRTAQPTEGTPPGTAP